MNGNIDLFTLLSLIVAAVAILKLRSVLGQRSSDDDDARIERMRAKERRQQGAQQGGAEIVTLPRTRREEAAGVPATETAVIDTEARIRAYPAGSQVITDGLLAIGRTDPQFDPTSFIKGAKTAYEMIVTAFADGDRKTLKNLLSRDVYESFSAAISERETRGERVDQKFVGISAADIVEAEAEDGTASVTVKFISQLITEVLNRSGQTTSGDPQAIKDVTDIWTFSRDVSNARALANPNWRLVATQAPN